MSGVTASSVSAAAWLSDEVLVVVDAGGAVTARWSEADVDESVLVDLRALLREHVAAGAAPARTALLKSLTALMAAGSASESLPQGLHVAREILRERLPLAVVDAGAAQLLHVERLHRLSDRSYIVQGWCAAEVASLAAVAPEGMRAELAARMFRYPRPDVEEFLGADRPPRAPSPFGFVAYFALEAPSRLRDGWVLELRDAAGRGVETGPLPAERDPAVVRDALLRDLSIARRRNEVLLDEHVRPALGELHARRVERVGIRDVDDFGAPPGDPALSLVVPLYGRIDLLEHQLVHFADDPELAGCELIYVLDSPELAEELYAFAAQLHALYRLPFRVVTLSENGGFSVATNLGASVARGERLLLVNSDVIPAAPGWTARMLEFYELTPQIGALAPKLVYEDDAIQHAGIYFERRPGGAEWWNEHFYK
ncbi:MAG TPA: glycosyltransferase, partial [Solirubrobacteraceae bacterium]